MENVTHSLVGATLAELSLPRGAPPLQRRLFFVVGIVAANLPDADLLYSSIIAPPLGYLLHHRGHTHTLGGLVALGLLVWTVSLVPTIARHLATIRKRFAALVVLALLSHVLLDSWNSYGVHPFWPLSGKWIYGDAIYIVEPWIWVFTGFAVVMNARRASIRRITAAVLVLATVSLAAVQMISWISLAVLVAASVPVALVMRKLDAVKRAWVAVACTAVFVVGMLAISRTLKGRSIAAAPTGGAVVETIMNPTPGNPLCWDAVAIVKREDAGEYVMTRGVVPLVPSLSKCGVPVGQAVRWGDVTHQSLVTLRTLYRENCSVRAWLQFARAPVFEERTVSDWRYGGLPRANFSSMPLPAPAACPAYITPWVPPRADLL